MLLREAVKKTPNSMALISNESKSQFITVKALDNYDVKALHTVTGLTVDIQLHKDSLYDAIKNADGTYQIIYNNTTIVNNVPATVVEQIMNGEQNTTVLLILMIVFFGVISSMPFWLPGLIKRFTK